MIKRVYRHALLVLLPLSLVLAIVESRRVSLGFLAGGVLALLNVTGLARGLNNLLLTHRPAIKLFMLGVLRLFIVFTIITLLAVSGLVNLPALAAGFTLVVLLVVIEGLRAARKGAETDEG